MMAPQVAMLGRRLHLQHGPIDLVIEAWGEEREVGFAYQQARAAFSWVLQTLVDELPQLRLPARGQHVDGPVARRMTEATTRHDVFVTPMAAVAGSVADHILSAMRAGRRLLKASVNNGGDIAVFLGQSESLTIGIGDVREEGVSLSPMRIESSDGIGGIATSGWRGRSHSLGIADFVTVFAKDAASADSAATLIANAVDVQSSDAVTRLPAEQLSPDSDLVGRLVTVDVGKLTVDTVSTALSSGEECAERMRRRGLISAAVLGLQGQRRVVGCGGLSPCISQVEQPSRIDFQGMGETA